MKVKTSELTGAALDWAVAVAQGFNPIGYSPSTKWVQGGPLRDRFKVSVFENVDTGIIQAIITTERKAVKQYPWQWSELGPTALIAICRAAVSCKLGAEVEVPDELVEAA